MKRHRLFSALPPAFILTLLLSSRAAGAFETLLPSGSVWRFHYDWNGLPATVRTAAFDDSTWIHGPAQLGYGEGDETTVINPYPPDKPASYTGDKPITAYFRRTIIPPAVPVAVLRLNLLRDDGVVIWLNGQELLRNNMPAGEITPATTALLSLGGAEELLPVRLFVPHPPFAPGVNSLMVEVHQATSTSNDISFDLAMDAWTGPEDSDNDGLPDWWEDTTFGNLASGAADDPDSDGSPNAEEYRTGTDPQNSASFLRPVISFNFSGRPFVEWQQIPGMCYRISWSGNLSTWDPVWSGTAIFSGFAGWEDATPAASLPSARFYRVEASRAPWPQ